MSEEKKLALLIDSDNVSAKYASFILQEASKYGELTCKRVYGDWEKSGNGWHLPAVNNAILPVQQTCYVPGKNATDFSIIIDAMDLLYSGTVDGFVLVTSDSDFTRLAIRLREAGKLVVGIGEVKTPIAFTSSCHHFSFLNQVCDNAGDYDEEALRASVVDFVKNSGARGTDLTKLDSFITSKYGNVDYNRFGFNRLSSFVDSFPELRRNSTYVLVKKTKPAPVPAPAPKVALTMDKICEAVKEYLASHGEDRDNMAAIEQYLVSRFGRIDYSGFAQDGSTPSKRFSKLLDRIPGIVRDGTTVSLANKLSRETFKSAVLEMVGASLEGTNLGLLNSNLRTKFGKGYLKELGFSDYGAALSSIPEIVSDNNQVYLAENAPDYSSAEALAEAASPVEDSHVEDIPSADDTSIEDEVPMVEDEPEKPEINAVKRFILSSAAQNDNGIALPTLGKLLSRRFGKEYLKELGFRTMKQLVGNMTGVDISDNRLAISEEFIRRTDEIEQFVYGFARGEGSRSVKALSMQIKKNFPGFDFTDYGYGKFSDFINAIDGVRANGYYVEPVDH